RLGRRQSRSEAEGRRGLVPGGQLAERRRDVTGAGEPRNLDLGVRDRVHREVAGDSTDRAQRRRDPGASPEDVRLTAHDEDLPRCIAWSFRRTMDLDTTQTLLVLADARARLQAAGRALA